MQRGPQIDERADVLELGGGIGKQVDRLLEQVNGLLAVDGAGERAQAGAARPRETDPVGEREMLLGQRTGGARLALGDECLAGWTRQAARPGWRMPSSFQRSAAASRSACASA